MRISDWSSDVCSSDLTPRKLLVSSPELVSGVECDGVTWVRGCSGVAGFRIWGRVAARANPGGKREAILQGRQEQTALTRVTSLLLCQRLFRGAERRAPAQAFARHAGAEPRHALATFQLAPPSRRADIRRSGVAEARDGVDVRRVGTPRTERAQRLAI